MSKNIESTLLPLLEAVAGPGAAMPLYEIRTSLLSLGVSAGEKRLREILNTLVDQGLVYRERESIRSPYHYEIVASMEQARSLGYEVPTTIREAIYHVNLYMKAVANPHILSPYLQDLENRQDRGEIFL